MLQPGHGHHRAVEVALLLYTGYNVAATLVSVPAGQIGDRHSLTAVLALGVSAFAAAYAGLAWAGPSIGLLLALFVIAGVGIGCVETAEHAVVATYASSDVRGSAFGVLAAVQSAGNLAASRCALEPRLAKAAFLYLTGWMLMALLLLARSRRGAR